ncbi:hypothetical protein D3C84_681140 [compost metagenome]
MTTTIDYLAQFGLSARKKGNRVVVSPRTLVTDDLLKYIRAHRLELLAELAADDCIERWCFWHVVRDGKTICTMVCEPSTYAEATLEVKARWIDAEVKR